jgi:hypothetical protein
MDAPVSRIKLPTTPLILLLSKVLRLGDFKFDFVFPFEDIVEVFIVQS